MMNQHIDKVQRALAEIIKAGNALEGEIEGLMWIIPGWDSIKKSDPAIVAAELRANLEWKQKRQSAVEKITKEDREVIFGNPVEWIKSHMKPAIHLDCVGTSGCKVTTPTIKP